MRTLLGVKLRIVQQRKPVGHFWDGETFSKAGRPVALCTDKLQLYPKDVNKFMTPEEMKTIPFCTKCLSMVKR